MRRLHRGEAIYWPTDSLPRPICNVTIQRIMDALEEPTSVLPMTTGPNGSTDGQNAIKRRSNPFGARA
jgi:hypothetical protein